MLSKHTFRGLEAIFAFDNWPMLLLGRLLDRKTGFVGYRKKGFDILIDHHGGDECGTRICIATDMYRKYLPSFNLPGPARVLDLGANGGGFPLMLGIAGVELDRVVCVEMNPLTYQRLQLNLVTNLRSSAVAINAAVCGMPEGTEIRMKPSRGGTGDSMYRDQAESTASHVSVPTTTLQALFDQYFKNEPLDICKIDIEGAEFELFASSPDDLLCRIRYLIMEIHHFHVSGPIQAPALFEKLAALGFKDITIEEGHETGAETEVRAFAGPFAGREARPEDGLVSLSERSAA
jgi:FkbM family methyltransferase